MASSSPTSSQPAQHPQRQKMRIRTSCRKINEFSAKIAAGEIPDVKYLREAGAALKLVREACPGTDHNETKVNVEVILGPLPSFLSQLNGNIEGTIAKIKEQVGAETTRAELHESEVELELESMLVISTKWYQILQRRKDEALQTRKAWEEKHPVRAAQELELSLYTASLIPLLEQPSARAIPSTKWIKAETSLESLQLYLLDNKILAEQIRSGGQKAIEPVLKDIIKQMEEWDAQGLGFRKDERIDIELVEKIWGRADKIGSGLSYLLTLDARGDTVDGVEHTTRSVFLMKSAPPIHFKFSRSKEAWLVKKLSESRKRLMEVVLSPDETDIKREDETRWNAAYRELDSLENFIKHEERQMSQNTVKDSRIDEAIELLGAKLKSLHVPLKADEDENSFALMYISYELTMRIAARLAGLPDP